MLNILQYKSLKFYYKRMLTITLAWVRGCDYECGPYPRTVLTVLGHCQDNKLTINKHVKYGCFQYSPNHWYEAKVESDVGPKAETNTETEVEYVAVAVTDLYLYLYLYLYPYRWYPYPSLTPFSRRCNSGL